MGRLGEEAASWLRLAEWRVSRLAGGTRTVVLIKQGGFDRRNGLYERCMITLRTANEI